MGLFASLWAPAVSDTAVMAMRDPLAGVDLSERLAQQLAFCVEVDKVKQVFRQNPVTDGTRKENDAEHMWHLALMAMVLAEYAVEPIDLGRVFGMVLVHDLVEIDAGDAFVYDLAARTAAVDRELAAADRIFAMLPADQAAWIRELWDEFEAKETVEARFAGALDRLQPMLMNATAGGGGWAEHRITADRVRATNSVIDHGSPRLWAAAQGILAQAVADGVLQPEVLSTS
jgi:putative hydrolases of HD superfamily